MGCEPIICLILIPLDLLLVIRIIELQPEELVGHGGISDQLSGVRKISSVLTNVAKCACVLENFS